LQITLKKFPCFHQFLQLRWYQTYDADHYFVHLHTAHYCTCPCNSKTKGSSKPLHINLFSRDTIWVMLDSNQQLKINIFWIQGDVLHNWDWAQYSHLLKYNALSVLRTWSLVQIFPATAVVTPLITIDFGNSTVVSLCSLHEDTMNKPC
jgi:hypothetical protein